MPSPDLSVEYCGLRLPHPIVVAPAGITETADHLRRCEDAGASAAVMKSYFEFEPARRHATPRFRVIRPGGPMSARVLYSFEQASVFDLQHYAEEIRRAKETCSIPVFASLSCNTEEHWLEACRAVEQAGADGIELNCSCPHGTHITRGDDIVDAIVGALGVARSATTLPLVPKITPQLARPDLAAAEAQEAGADAVILFNRFTGLDIDIETQQPVMHGGYAGYGGTWAIHYVLRWLTATYPLLSIPIAASGGVFDAAGAIKMILAGATVVQVCSVIVVEGYEAIGGIVQGLAEYLERHERQSLAEIRGIVCNRLVTLENIDRRNRVHALVDPSTCKSCGTCLRVCIYGAVSINDKKYRIDPEQCDGCGLCAELCPARAITMIERPVPLERG